MAKATGLTISFQCTSPTKIKGENTAPQSILYDPAGRADFFFFFPLVNSFAFSKYQLWSCPLGITSQVCGYQSSPRAAVSRASSPEQSSSLVCPERPWAYFSFPLLLLNPDVTFPLPELNYHLVKQITSDR